MYDYLEAVKDDVIDFIKCDVDDRKILEYGGNGNGKNKY